jgi:polysaccharide pyruvyl transferase WcaK-like protein
VPSSLASELTARGHGLRQSRARLLRSDFSTQAKWCDLVFDIGEGDSFATLYGFKRFFFYWLSKNRVRNANVPLVLAPQTIGPFDSWLARRMAVQVMRRCTRVFARDDLSRQYLADLGLDDVAAQATDLAFALPFTRRSLGDGTLARVGVNVSGLLFSGGYTGGNQFGLSLDYATTVRSLVRRFAAMPGVEVHLVSHVIVPDRSVEDDLAAARTIAAEVPGVVVAPMFERPSEAKSYIAGLDFFTGARMHACIAALSSGVPVVPMAYSRKFNGLFGTLGYLRLADCKVDTAETVIRKVIEGFEDRVAVRQEVGSALASIKQRLSIYEQCIAAMMQDVVRSRGASS